MEGKVIKEEIAGSPCSPPRPPSGTNTTPNSSIPTNTNPGSGSAPSGKENRRVASPLTTSEILTRSRSKGITRENCHHPHTHHHHRMSESPKMVGIGPVPGAGTSTQQQSPPMPNTKSSSFGKGHGGQGFGHSFSSLHSTPTNSGTTNGNGLGSTGGSGRVTSPSVSPTGSVNNGIQNGGRTNSSSSTVSNSGSSKTDPHNSGSGSGSGRLIVKIKRFLGTLLHFGCDISPEVGDRVQSLVFNLVSGHLSIEDFHHSLQDVTSFPLRPFVLPFLKAHLPLLQREISHLARISKQSTLSFVRSHEQVIVEPGTAPGEPYDIFHSESGDPGGLPGKRKNESLYENGEGESSNYTSTPKRFNGGLFSPPFFLPNLSNSSSGGSMPPSSSSADLRDYYSTAGYHLLSSQLHSLQQESGSGPNHQPTTTPLPGVNGMTSTPKAPEDEWRNIHVMLNIILSMVEKTKRALTILQTRTFHNELESNSTGTSSSSSGSNSWLRRPGTGAFSSIDSADDFKRHAGEMMAQALRATEDRVAEVKRRAEDAVLEVKRQALVELQRAVAAAEARACEAVAAERARLERVFLDSRRSGADIVIPTPPVDPETCWNCGRKAHETCSGCNMARYCSSFCQHKDWEHHHNVCGRNHSSSASDRETRSVTTNNPETKNLHVQENSNSPINVSNPSPDNRSTGSV